nr:hypothetical protein [Natronorubrum halophilum]
MTGREQDVFGDGWELREQIDARQRGRDDDRQPKLLDEDEIVARLRPTGVPEQGSEHDDFENDRDPQRNADQESSRLPGGKILE